jgi:RNA polymerase-binding transcription factor DksA
MTEAIKKKLLEEQKSLQSQLAVYKSEDPLMDPEQNTSNTMDDVITVAEGHDRIVATRLELKQRLAEVTEALRKIEEGSFGICGKCQEKISEERLEVLPTAKFCLNCESKAKVGT